ncbi:hypothetical protein BTUL_0279g00120 [Botrytis tulipae]|uniref:Uncharacterized protein n=1 Tax=Botrytis tulipae TaxID=87230 RepID=A0A4Z1E5W7_9HELO|nr:hypothetical protein BTUL_0279g00120 [Botrytis tulipae]
MFVLISLFGGFAIAFRSQPLTSCSPWVHGWPFYFGTQENCDAHIEDYITLWVIGILYLIMTLLELEVWRGSAYHTGRVEATLDILGKLAKLDGEKRLEATEKLLRHYGSLLKVFEVNEKYLRDNGLVEKVVEEDKNLLIDLGVAEKVVEEDKNLLIDLGVVEKAAEEDLERDLEKGTLLIEL